MSNLFEYNYPGRYLLINYNDEFYKKLLDSGYIVHRFNSINSIDCNIVTGPIDYFYIKLSTETSNFLELCNLIDHYRIKNLMLSIECVDESHLDFIDTLIDKGYQINSNDKIKVGEEKVDIEITSIKSHQHNFKLNREIIYLKERIDKIVSYICSGDEILIVDDGNNNIRNYLSYQIISDKIKFIQSSELLIRAKNKQYNIIFFIDKKITFDSVTLEFLSESLLPSGRCILFNINTKIRKLLTTVNLDIESYSSNDKISSSIVNYSGSIENFCSSILIFMRNPLIFDNFKYNESFYGYNSPPDNLLAFQRDYINPWIVRSLVEFPSRNKSTYNLRNYCNTILETYPLLSPDYGAALAVLGYQYLNNHLKDDFIIQKITSYCSDIEKESFVSPHQTRWYISLSTLLGLIYRKKGFFFKSMPWFSKAYQSSERKFSPTIATKILQSYYMNITMLISLEKITSATVLLDSSINRIIDFFNVHENELLGRKKHPLNFVMYIYHDIIDWTIKLINIKRSLNINRMGSFYLANKNTWSSLLSERMEAINFQSLLINERDITIKDQTKIIDDRGLAIESQSIMIDERDNTIKDQAKLIDERDNTIRDQTQLIDERDITIRQQAQLLEERESTILSQEKIIKKLQDLA